MPLLIVEVGKPSYTLDTNKSLSVVVNAAACNYENIAVLADEEIVVYVLLDAALADGYRRGVGGLCGLSVRDRRPAAVHLFPVLSIYYIGRKRVMLLYPYSV